MQQAGFYLEEPQQLSTTRSRRGQRGVAYLRVSTSEQELGLEAQRGRIAEWSERAGVEVVAECVDQGVSGATPLERRAGLLAALDALKVSGCGLLVVANRDRLARDVVICAVVERLATKAGAEVVSADGVGVGTGPEAELMRVMIDGFAQYERAVIRARTRAALAAKRARGEAIGPRARYGERVVNGRLEGHQGEQDAVELILQLHRDGESVRGIALKLNAFGVPCRGRRWHRSTVHRILQRHSPPPRRSSSWTEEARP